MLAPAILTAEAISSGEAGRPEATGPIEAVFGRIHAASRAKGAPSLEERALLLDRLEAALLAQKRAIVEVVGADFGHRAAHETLLADVFDLVAAIRHAKANLADWMAVQPREAAAAFFPSSAKVVFQPLGVVGIISPWNYPLQLALGPLVSALAAGNRALIKPSELTPRTADKLAEIVADTFPEDHVAVVRGGPDVGGAFARQPFDHLVFTGSPRVGQMVMRAASENLVPVTLELGGKCPAIVGAEARVRTGAERIMAGKTFNAGQTCLAPDYALIPSSMKDGFVQECRRAVARLYPTLARNPDYTAIASKARYDRLREVIDDAKTRGGTVLDLGPAEESPDADARKLAPVLVLNPARGMLCMREEIFGPILPIVTYDRLSDAIAHVNDGERPLALYYFGHDQASIDRILSETTSGGVTINETMLHFLQADLPFGGIGKSGMGRYHGRDGFEALSHKKAVFEQSPLSPTGLLKPPHGRTGRALLRLLLGG
jgi:coniferyl-aldehyde dehydrogenase